MKTFNKSHFCLIMPLKLTYFTLNASSFNKQARLTLPLSYSPHSTLKNKDAVCIEIIQL